MIRSEENKDNYKREKNLTRKIVSRALRGEAEQAMNNLCDKSNNVFKLIKFLKKEGQDVNGGRCLRGINSRVPFSKKDQKRVWKEYIKKSMNKENAWDQKTKIGIVEGLVEEVSLEEITNVIKKMKFGKASGLLEVSMEMINARGKVGIEVMMKFCQRVLDGKRMLED